MLPWQDRPRENNAQARRKLCAAETAFLEGSQSRVGPRQAERPFEISTSHPGYAEENPNKERERRKENMEPTDTQQRIILAQKY